MKLIIKKQKTDRFLVCNRYSNLSFQEYSDRISKYTNKQIRSIYKEVFDRECVVNVVWAKYQIHYELARQMQIKQGIVEPLQRGSAFRKAYEGTMACDLEHTGDTLKTLIPFELKNYDENSPENIMKQQKKVAAIKKAVEAKKSKCIGVTTGLSVYDAWVYAFKKNEKEHKPDEEITKFLLSEFPDHQIKSFHAVHACRINYNNGRYTNGVKPEVKSVRYLADGSVWKRGHKAAEVAKKAAPVAKKVATVAKKAAPAKKKAVIVKKSK